MRRVFLFILIILLCTILKGQNDKNKLIKDSTNLIPIDIISQDFIKIVESFPDYEYLDDQG